MQAALYLIDCLMPSDKPPRLPQQPYPSTGSYPCRHSPRRDQCPRAEESPRKNRSTSSDIAAAEPVFAGHYGPRLEILVCRAY